MADDVLPLAFPFTSGGYSHTLRARSGPWCVVERVWVEDGLPHLPHFEIVHLRIVSIRRWPDGRITPAHEAYPPPAAWGREAWSDPTLVHARTRWDSLHASHPDLPPWDALAIPDDPDHFAAWKAGRLPPKS